MTPFVSARRRTVRNQQLPAIVEEYRANLHRYAGRCGPRIRPCHGFSRCWDYEEGAHGFLCRTGDLAKHGPDQHDHFIGRFCRVTLERMNDEAKDLPASEDEWRERLTPEQFAVTRQCGTERAFTGKYWDHHEDGTYRCVCCGAELFDADTKFDSGTGWPSFWAPLEDARLRLLDDFEYGMKRTEVRCANCDAHLGHVFPDGPNPTGLRYCMNSASLDHRPRTSG